MAIFSLNHKPIGKSTHSSGRAGAHIRYISRASAEAVILSNGMPSNWRKAKDWINRQEQQDRRNARIADRVMVALPVQLDGEQRTKLLQEYMAEITGNDVPWYAAIHQTGEDIDNPHAHILIRDRSLINGRRVIKTSERGSTQHFREKWSEKANKALLRAFGDNAPRIDHRSLKAQGINREPTKHRGWEQKELSKEENELKSWVQKIEFQDNEKRGFLRA